MQVRPRTPECKTDATRIEGVILNPGLLAKASWKGVFTVPVAGQPGGSFSLEPCAVDLNVGQSAVVPVCPGLG